MYYIRSVKCAVSEPDDASLVQAIIRIYGINSQWCEKKKNCKLLLVKAKNKDLLLDR